MSPNDFYEDVEERLAFAAMGRFEIGTDVVDVRGVAAPALALQVSDGRQIRQCAAGAVGVEPAGDQAFVRCSKAAPEHVVNASRLRPQDIGVGQWFRYATGICELAGGVMVLVRRTRLLGAALLACVMAGAVATHLAILHTSPAGPLALLVRAGIVIWGRRSDGGRARSR